MKNDELDQLLKSSPAPPRTDEYWSNFPKRIAAKLHWQSSSHIHPAVHPVRKLNALLVGSLGLATVCVAIGFIIKFQPQPLSGSKEDPLAAARKCYREFEELFPNQLQAIVFDQHGPRMILADRANVPNAAPLYLKVCGPKGCEGIVTFSGQQIPFNGENCEVLADGEGRVMLVGNHRVWSQTDPSADIRIQARLL